VSVLLLVELVEKTVRGHLREILEMTLLVYTRIFTNFKCVKARSLIRMAFFGGGQTPVLVFV
jgi:hypothetical protein